MFRLLFQPVSPELNNFDSERDTKQFLRGEVWDLQEGKAHLWKDEHGALRNQPRSLHDREYIIGGYGECKPGEVTPESAQKNLSTPMVEEPHFRITIQIMDQTPNICHQPACRWRQLLGN